MNGLPDSSFSNVNRLKPTDASGNFTLSLIPSNINMLSSDISKSNVSIDIATIAKQIQWYYHIKTDKTRPHDSTYEAIGDFSNQTVTKDINGTDLSSIAIRYIHYLVVE